jgi:hypothetical protein
MTLNRIMCWLSFHKLKTFAEIEAVDFVECEHCKRRWAVATDDHTVYELRAQ